MSSTPNDLICLLESLRVKKYTLDKEENWLSYDFNIHWGDEREEITWIKRKKLEKIIMIIDIINKNQNNNTIYRQTSSVPSKRVYMGKHGCVAR
jgi:hypothetical protein